MLRTPLIKTILLGLLLLALLVPACGLAQSAVVDNGSDPESRLNLRAKPAKDAAVLGKFYSGTPVEIVADAGGGFAQVRIGGEESTICGYMMLIYLKDTSAVDATTSMQVVSPYGTPSVVLRDAPSDSYGAVAMLAVGDTVRRIGVSGDFAYVLLEDGTAGCLASDELAPTY